jgi:hypothetical protein
MDSALQRAVRDRAKHRCEYCQFPEAFSEVPSHVDHVIARQHGGPSELNNLALACCFCNRYKGPNLSVVRLFHPREHVWMENFAWNGPRLIGPHGDWPRDHSGTTAQSRRCNRCASTPHARRSASAGLKNFEAELHRGSNSK